jgi:2-methylcitrate dehydratase PrpD
VKLPEIIGEYASGLTIESLDANVLEALKVSILDTVGCMISGTQTPEWLVAASGLGLHEGYGEASILGTRLRADYRIAALAHGFSGHVEDYDDYDVRAAGHPGVAIVPAALAAARSGCSGPDFIAGVAAGYETMILLGTGLKRLSYNLGYHGTGTFGAIASSIAAARVYGLDVEQTITAASIGISQAAGSREQFGTMAKAYHAGHAAMAGVLAADLARAGFSASRDAFDGPAGYLRAHSADAEAAIDLASTLTELARSRLGCFIGELPPSLKLHASCGASHAAVDCAVKLRPYLQSSSIERIEIAVPSQSMRSLFHHAPTTGLEGKFSAEYSVAVALLFGDALRERFVDAVARQSEVQRLIGLTAVKGDGELQALREREDCLPARVEVNTAQGSRAAETRSPRGSGYAPLTWDEAAGKFLSNTASLRRSDAQHALDAVQQLESAEDIQDVFAPLIIAAV